jgi:membrane protein DedA with SNARE-associated domain
MRCAKQPSAVFYFPLFAALGSVLGCLLLYTIARRGGQALLRRRFRVDHIRRVERAYARWGFMALAVPALMPPPMPFKIFVATAGALEYPRWRFMLTVMIARSFRYFVEGTLAVFYGERVLSWIKENGAFILLIVGAVFLCALVVYFIKSRGRPAAEETEETAASTDA